MPAQQPGPPQTSPDGGSLGGSVHAFQSPGVTAAPPLAQIITALTTAAEPSRSQPGSSMSANTLSTGMAPKRRRMLWRDLVKDKKLKTIAVSLHLGKVTEERRGNQEEFSRRPSEFLLRVKEANRSHGPRAWHSDKKDTESRSTTPRGSL